MSLKSKIAKAALKTTTIVVGGLVGILVPRSMPYVISTIRDICDRVDIMFENGAVVLHNNFDIESVNIIPEVAYNISTQTLYDNTEEQFSVIGHTIIYEEA